MIQLLERAADRAVSTVVPKTTAGACACGPGDAEWQICYCSGGHLYQRRVTYTCNCTPVNGPCHRIAALCP